MHVQLIFFGTAWATSTTTPSATQVTNAIQTMLAGPYMSYLAQYGIGRATLRGTTFFTGADPLNQFPVAGSGGITDDYIGNFVTGLIDKEMLPEPDEDAQIFCCVITPPNISSSQPGIAGYNSKVEWDDLDLGDVDNDPIHYGWIGNDGTLNYVTEVFSHELVEACTDPGGGTGIIASPGTPGCPPTGPCQIGDVCGNICDTVNGVAVQACWSQLEISSPLLPNPNVRSGGCVVPQLYSVRRTLAGRNIAGKISSLGSPIPSLTQLIKKLF